MLSFIETIHTTEVFTVSTHSRRDLLKVFNRQRICEEEELEVELQELLKGIFTNTYH